MYIFLIRNITKITLDTGKFNKTNFKNHLWTILIYNLERHIKLLNDQKKILDQNKSFSKENEVKFLELNKDGLIVDQHIF